MTVRGHGVEAWFDDVDPAALTDGDTLVWNAAAQRFEPGAGGSGASGVAPAQAVTPGTSFNYEAGDGDYAVNVLANPTDGYCFAFQRPGDDFPFLAVTDVGDWVVSDGTYDPTNHPTSFIGLQYYGSGGGGLRIAGGSADQFFLVSTGIKFQSRTGQEMTADADGLKLSFLPTADPHVADALWNSAGTVKISAGP